MALEKKWEAVAPRAFTVDGGSEGEVVLPTTDGLRVKQVIILKSNIAPARKLQIQRVESDTTIRVGELKSQIHEYTSIVEYLVSDSATLEAPEQNRPSIDAKEHARAVFAEEPTVAKRVTLVDFLGKFFSKNNPLPVRLAGDDIQIGTVNGELEVQLSHQDNVPDAGDIHDSVRIGGESDEAAVDSDKNLHVETHYNAPDGTDRPERGTGIDETNSTNTPLTAGSEFTGGWFDAESYSNLTVTVFTDQDSAEDGLIVEYSSDGINIDDSDVYTISQATGPGGDNRQFSFPVPQHYYRVRYINGSVNQSEFRLQTKLHQNRPKPSSHRIKDPVLDDNDAELVKAILTAKNPNGQFVNSKLDGRKDDLSTTTPLGAGGSFISPIIDLEGYLTVDFTVLSNVESASNGIMVEWFLDAAGTQLIKTSLFTYNIINEGAFYNMPVQAKYVRLKYVNGSTAQGSFFLDTRLRNTPNIGLLSQVENNLTGDLLAVLARAILFGRTEAGTLTNVELSNSNSLKVAVTDRPSEVRARSPVLINIPNTVIDPTGTIFYSVTPGKTLYIQSFNISQLNAASANGVWTLNDGATPQATYIMPARVSGTSPSAATSTSPTMPEPMSFSTNVRIVEIAGDINVSGFMIGYEE